jgi:hypothetical protein
VALHVGSTSQYNQQPLTCTHDSFCFRTLGEFVTKMTGYSHADRVGGDRSLLDPARIQDTICKGGE